MNDFFDFTGKYIDDYIPNNKLVQCYEYTLGPTDKLGISDEKWVILCYNLNIGGDFTNWSGDITIFCKNIICNGKSIIQVSGKHSDYKAIKKGAPQNGERNGVNADNSDDKKQQFAELLNGQNGGKIAIYAQNIFGELILKANGGDGSNGQEGGDAVPAIPGNNGNKITTIETDLTPALQTKAKGGDGQTPAIGGDGAKGGKAGDGGHIHVYVKNEIEVSYETSAGEPGEGGKGGLGKVGGAGGKGGQIIHEHTMKPSVKSGGEDYVVKKSLGYGFDGVGYESVNGKNGEPGEKGDVGKPGTYSANSTPLDFVSHLTPNYLRSLILQTEDYYLNNDLKTSAEILEWMLEIEYQLKNHPIAPAPGPSEYYTSYSLQELEPFFSKAKVYLNQILQGVDFFGNFPNYTTLLDESFLDQMILNYKPSIVAFEALLDKTLNEDYATISNIAGKNQIKDAITKNIELARQENIELFKTIGPLNDEILKRLAETETIKRRIEELKKAFEKAVADATNGCSWQDTLSTITKIVSIAVAVSSGVGAIGTAAAIASDSASLLEDFKGKYNKTNPGFDVDKWKEIIESGKDKDPSKDTSIITKVEKIQKQGGSFEKDVQAIATGYNKLTEKKSSLVTIPQADLSNASNKQKFIQEMQAFVSKYDVALAYQNEVIFFFDFCDITNQKRLQFTNTTLQIIKNTNNIVIYENDISEVNSNLLKLNENKLNSYAKTVIIETYLKLRLNYVKLLYLQKKSIDFLSLTNEEFSVDFYNGRIDAIDATYMENKKSLTKKLISSNPSEPETNADVPYVISELTHPLSFKALRESVFSEDIDIPIYFNFNIPINGTGLDHIREIKLVSVRIYLDGAKTDTGSIVFNLKHFGNSLFLTTKNEIIEFNHNPVIKTLKYSIKDKDKIYENHFNKIKSIYYSGQIESDYYVGISPFASWQIQIPNRSTNKGLDLSNLEKIKIVFEFKSQSEIYVK